MHQKDPDFLMRDVLMLEGSEEQVLGHYTEELRSAYRSSYSIFDKVALFVNDYFSIGLRPRDVTFRRIWSEKGRGTDFTIRSEFRNSENWHLRGLYFLSMDLFGRDFGELAEPDAKDLAKLRQQIEHRFLSFQHMGADHGSETHLYVSVQDFQKKALRLLKMAREALIYLSLAMHREERRREESLKNS